MKPLLAILLAGLAGCLSAWQRDNLYSDGCEKSYEGDIIVLTCLTQEQVTSACAKHATTADSGFAWDREGRGPNGQYIAACTEWSPRWRYPFRIWIWRDEAWRRTHEEGCHVALFRKFGHHGDHSICADYGYGKPRKRI